MLRHAGLAVTMRRLLVVVLWGLATVPVLLVGSSSARILCESLDYKFTTCNVSGLGDHIVSVALDQQLSSTNCVLGSSYGLNSTLKAIWVSGGCRGYFTVQVLPTDYSTSPDTRLQRDSTSSRTEAEVPRTELSTSAEALVTSAENMLTTSTEVTSSPASDRSSARNQRPSSSTNVPDWTSISSKTTFTETAVTTSSKTTFTETAVTTSRETIFTETAVTTSRETTFTETAVTTSRETTFTENAVTTSAISDPMPTNTSSGLCPCLCRLLSLGGEAEIAAMPVDRVSFSKRRRKKKSANDGRTSSVVMGTGAVAILCTVAAMFPLLDLEHIVRALKHRRQTRNFCSPRLSSPEEHGSPVST